MTVPHATPCSHCGGSGVEPLKFDPAKPLDAISTVWGKERFLSREIMRLARDNNELRAALGGLRGAGALGIALAAIKGQPFDGLVVEDTGKKEHEATIWRVTSIKLQTVTGF